MGLHEKTSCKYQYIYKIWFAPIKATGRGENLIGICFQHDGVKQTKKGLPVVTVSPVKELVMKLDQ